MLFDDGLWIGTLCSKLLFVAGRLPLASAHHPDNLYRQLIEAEIFEGDPRVIMATGTHTIERMGIQVTYEYTRLAGGSFGFRCPVRDKEVFVCGNSASEMSIRLAIELQITDRLLAEQTPEYIQIQSQRQIGIGHG